MLEDIGTDRVSPESRQAAIRQCHLPGRGRDIEISCSFTANSKRCVSMVSTAFTTGSGSYKPKGQAMPFMDLTTSESRPSGWLYKVVVGFIAVVSLYDAALVVLYADVIAATEQNPIGSYLIAINGDDPSLFVLLKLIGTALTVVVLLELFQKLRHLAVPVVTGVASAQMSLLLYLSFA